MHMTRTLTPTQTGPKLYVNSPTDFSGQPIKCEAWELVTKFNLGQTMCKNTLESPPSAVNVVMEEDRNNELYLVRTTSFMQGSGMYVLQNLAVTDNGNAAFVAIQDWDGAAAASRTIINHHCKKVKYLTIQTTNQRTQHVVAQTCWGWLRWLRHSPLALERVSGSFEVPVVKPRKHHHLVFLA
jgi:hypothetical protein